MVAKEYKLALKAAMDEYVELIRKQEQLEKRIAEVKQIMVTLGPLCGHFWVPDHFGPVGLTEACRNVLRVTGQALVPTEVKLALGKLGHDMRRYKNPLASIHTILKRLVKSRQAKPITTEKGKTAYQWIEPKVPVAFASATTRTRRRLVTLSKALRRREKGAESI